MSSIVRQFAHPTGPTGWLVGHLMAVKNGERSRWALELLQPRPGESILEIGFGPGVDVRRLSAAVGASGRIAGVDVSDEMVRQAAARNRAKVRDGRVTVRQGSVAALPFADECFEAACSTNSAQFWPDLQQGMAEIYRVLRPGGRAVIVVQPMTRGSTAADSTRWRDRLQDAMHVAGFVPVSSADKPMRPAPAAAAIGWKGAPRS